MNRRNFIYGGGASLLLANAPNPILQRAIDRAGGYQTLRRVRRLSWTGQATIFTARAEIIEIGLRTNVVPFISARSDSWLLKHGPSKTNTLLIERSQAWIVRVGREPEPMPDAMAAHERAQYALYGLMLLAPLYDRGAVFHPGPVRNSLLVRHPAAPQTTLGFDDKANLKWASNKVPSAELGAEIKQRFAFEGEIRSGNVRWPRRIKIEQDGVPYFDLQLHTFQAQIT